MNDTILTVARYYREGGVPKVETVLWKYVRSSHDDSRGEVVDPGLAARARPLPAEHDPGLSPNQWVWVAAETPAVKLPRPTEQIRGFRTLPTGEVIDTVDHAHAAGAAYWSYYSLPFRSGVELIDEETYRSEVAAAAAQKAKNDEARKQATVEAKNDRATQRASAAEKLSKLGLTEDEIRAVIGG